MTFDYKKMFKEAMETGQPVMRSRLLNYHEHTSPPVSGKTFDTTATHASSHRCNNAYQVSLVSRNTRTQLRGLIVTCPSGQHAKKVVGGIPHVKKDPFPQVVNDAFGEANTSNIHGQDDYQILEAIFEALLEREAARQYRSGSNLHLQRILNINEGWGREDMTVAAELGIDNELKWSINRGQRNGTTWIALLCAEFNLPRIDGVTTLANILKMCLENLYQLSSAAHAADLNGGALLGEDVPKRLHLQGISREFACITLEEKKYIYGNAGQVTGAFLRYRLNGQDFCLPATVARGVLCLGKCKPTAHFLNEDLIDKFPFAKIIFCQDMRSALALQRILDETHGHNPAETIVTAHLGTDLSVMPWGYFHGHNVVFVPAPTKESMAVVKLYRDHITGAQAKSFRVYCGFLLHSQPSCDLTGPVEGVTDAEAELLRMSVRLDAVERPLSLVQKVDKNAVPYDGFLEWGQQMGIFSTPQKPSSRDSTNPPRALSLFNPNLGPAAPQAVTLDKVTSAQVFVPGGITLVHGLKDSGKSMTCFAVAKSILTGAPLFKIISGGEPSKILYLDSETPQDLLTARLDQFGLVGEVNKRLFLVSKSNHMCTDFAFSITDPLFRDHVEKTSRGLGCRYLVLDNLTSLMADGGLYQAQTVSQLFNWIEHLARHGVGVIIVSHTLDDSNAGTAASKARGSQEFSIRAHTELVLIRSTEILQQHLGTEAVQHAAAQDGLAVGICIKVCKAACVLQKKTLWLHLPLGASEWKFLAATGSDGKEIKIPQRHSGLETAPPSRVNASSDVIENADSAVHNPLPKELEDVAIAQIDSAESDNLSLASMDLSADERKVYEFARTGGRVKTSKIVALVGCLEGRARCLIKSLKDRGLLEHDGKKGPQQGYRIKK